jgi:hypothetical protein
MALCACAAPAPVGPLTLHADDPDPARVEARFAESVANRYGGHGSRDAIETDLKGSGFACTEPPPVEARGDYLMAHCALARPRGFCTDLWIVDLRYAGPAGVTPHAAFRRTCVGPAAPHG